MKILLSPLNFVRSACKRCATLLYKSEPDAWWWEYEMERMPPLGSFVKGEGFIPDLPILTMFEEFALDGSAYEEIRSTSSDTWLGPWPDVIRLLDAEGALAPIDTTAVVKQQSRRRGAMLRHDLADPARWASAMDYHDNLIAGAKEALGSHPGAADHVDWEYNPDKTPGVVGLDDHVHLLPAVLASGLEQQPNKDDPHVALYEDALSYLKVLLREVNAGLAVAESLGTPPMFWAPYVRFLEEKGRTTGSVEERAEAARLFFSVAFPRFSPKSVRQLGDWRADRRIGQLRTEISRAMETGDVVDPDYPQRIIEEVMSIETRVRRSRRVGAWVGGAISTVPVPGLGAVAGFLQELIERKVEQVKRREADWFYLISDGRGHS